MVGGRFLAVRPDAPWHDKFAGGGDRLLAGWLRMLCRAKQMERVCFPSADALADALAVPPDLVADMIERELIDRDRKGGVTIHDWEDHQQTFSLEKYRADAARRKREQRSREREEVEHEDHS
jgi:hypothetical protein